MIFSSKPYHLDDELLASAPSRLDETPLEYHVNHHTQTCSCGRTNCWSELTLISFHRARKVRIVRAAANVEYNLPIHIHNHTEESISLCFFCAPFKTFSDLPTPELPVVRAIPLGWRKISQPAEPKTKQKVVVTDDDLLA